MAFTAYNPILYLWEKRTLFIGSLEGPFDISTGSATFMVSLDGPIRFKTHNMASALECHSLLLPAGSAVVIDTEGAAMANCTLDPFGEDFDSLMRLMQENAGSAYYQLQNENDLIEKLQVVSSSPMESLGILQSIVQTLTPKREGPDSYFIDPRITHVVDIIQNTISENLSVSDLEKAVNLSSSRLTELFKQQTGLPIRRYRLWHRLYVTVMKIGQGMNITDAAVESGFTDSSHFVRTFRSMLGMTPSCVFAQARPLHIILP